MKASLEPFDLEKEHMFGEKKRKYCTCARLTCGLFLLLGLLSKPVLAEQKCNEAIISSTPDANFLLHNDGTVLQKTTGLTWMRCASGQTWDGRTCSGSAARFTWAEALQNAARENFAGYQDWRLPNKNELDAIVEERCVAPAINKMIFPATPPDYFWSSSPYSGLSTGAWSADFSFGVVTASEKKGRLHMRLVRDVMTEEKR